MARFRKGVTEPRVGVKGAVEVTARPRLANGSEALDCVVFGAKNAWNRAVLTLFRSFLSTFYVFPDRFSECIEAPGAPVEARTPAGVSGNGRQDEPHVY